MAVRENDLRFGLFGPNCSSGRTYATLPDRWEASWENNVRLAQLADAIGIEAMVPIARWKGYGGASNPNGSSFESIAWACGLLAATRRLSVFCTIHVPLHHPVVAAKQMATGDHIGQGRLGVNIVCGWNEDEFQMFGVTKEEHDARYAQGEEWWSIVKRIWAGEGPFDHEGRYYRLHGVEGSPRPHGGRAPRMMNAGSSETGRQFAIRHSDMHFDAVIKTPEASTARIAETKRLARERGRDIQVWTPVGIVCRPTQKEADDFVQYVVDHADWGAIGYLAAMHAREGRAQSDPQDIVHSGQNPIARRALARGSYCVVGDPEAVARELARLRAAGLDGLAINFVDYLKELPYFAGEVLPRLEKLGLRTRTPRLH